MVKNPPANAEDTDSSLIQEDPIGRGATKPMHHSYWACALEPGSRNYEAHVLQLLKPVHPRSCAQQQEKSAQWEAHTLQWRVATARHS